MKTNTAITDTAGAAAYLGRSPGTLQNWRSQGVGPRFGRVGGVGSSVFYRYADLDEWLESRLVA